MPEASFSHAALPSHLIEQLVFCGESFDLPLAHAL